MSTISQSVPNLLLGISQQPDNRKRPGQVKDALNAFPDFALGMLKRPGGKFVSKLDGASTTGKWHPILRDAVERYISQFNPATNDFRVWNLRDEEKAVVDMAINGQSTDGRITGNGPPLSTRCTYLFPGGTFNNPANIFDGNENTFAAGSIINTAVTIQWPATFNVTYTKLEIRVGADVNAVDYGGNTTNGTGSAAWLVIDANPGTLTGNIIVSATSGTAEVGGIRINGDKVLIDNDPNFNLTAAQASLTAANTALINAENSLQVAGSNLAKCIAGQTPEINKLFKTDFRQLSNPRAQDYSSSLKEFLKSGIIENEETYKQATATVSVSNEITGVNVATAGAGYETPPALSFGGSGSAAAATVVLSDTGDLKRIDVTNAGADYIDVPTVTFGGGLSSYQGTAVYNWFTKKVTKVLVEDGDVIDLTDASERYDLSLNVGKVDSMYGGRDGDFESQFLVPADKIGYNTGRPNMTFSKGDTLASGPQGLYLKSRDLTGKSKIRIMAVTGNRDNIPGLGNVPANRTSPATGLDTVDGGDNGTYQHGTFNAGDYNDHGITFDVYIAREGITPKNNDMTTPPIWRGGGVSGDEPNGYFANARPGESLRSDWRHIGQIFASSAATNTDKPYYLSEYEFNIPADLQTDKCFICIGASSSTPSIGNPDTSRRFAVTTLTLLNATPTTTNIPDSTVTFNVNAKSANAQSLFNRWNTTHSFAPHYYNKLLVWRNGTVTPTTPTTTAVADVVTGKSLGSVNLTNAGSGYNVGAATTASLTGGSFTSAGTVTVEVTPTFTATLTEAGKGYESATATLTGGGGSGAAVAVNTTRGEVSGFTFTGGDSFYTSNPTITLSTPNVEGAEAARTVIKKDDQVLHGAANFVSIKQMGVGISQSSGTDIATTTNGNGTGIKVNLTVTSGQVTEATIHTNGSGYFTGDELYPTGYPDIVLRVEGIAKATERTDEHPVLASTGYRIYEAEESTAPLFNDNDLNHPSTGKLALYNAAKTTYDNAVTAQENAANLAASVKSLLGVTPPNNTLDVTAAGSGIANGYYYSQATATTGSGANMTVDLVVEGGKVVRADINGAGTNYEIGDEITLTSGTFSGVKLQFAREPYLKGATADDIELLTINDYTFIVNKSKYVEMHPDKTHPLVDEFRAAITIQVGINNSNYRAYIGGVNCSITSSSSNPGSIATQLKNEINAEVGANTAYAIGPTVIVTKSSEFTLSVRGGNSASAITGFTDSIGNVSNLPLHCKNGYVVKVTNAADIDLDDMYVEFTANNNANYGVGQWTETTKPGITYKFDPKTMPHALVNTAEGEFELREIDWNERLTGDDTNTNKDPTFVGGTISNMFFYRGRMGLLSGQNVIMSQAGDIFNFWNQTARTSLASDPIDISAAGKKSVFLKYVAPASVGLVLYSANEQFILTTDADVLTPTSTKINQLSAYECDESIEAVPLGTTQALISKTPLFTRVFELSEISSDQPPVMQDITNVVPELIEASVTSMVASPALSIVSLGEQGKPDIYQYRFLNRGRDQRELNSWYRWKLTGNLLGQFFDASTWYAVVSNGSDVYVQSFDMTQSNESGFLTLPTGEKTDVCLDLFNNNPHRTYDSTTDKTRVFLPYDDVSGSELNVVVLGGYIGDTTTAANQSIGAVLKPTIAGTAGNKYVDINGDYRGRNIIIGYNYTMEIELPELYKYTVDGGNVSNDDVSSLILHRLKFKTGLSGPVDYRVSITGREDWDNAVSVTQPNQYELNNVNMQAKATHVVPVFQRNENLAVKIIGNTPFPVSLLGLDWEGKFNQRFYRRG